MTLKSELVYHISQKNREEFPEIDVINSDNAEQFANSILTYVLRKRRSRKIPYRCFVVVFYSIYETVCFRYHRETHKFYRYSGDYSPHFSINEYGYYKGKFDNSYSWAYVPKCSSDMINFTITSNIVRCMMTVKNVPIQVASGKIVNTDISVNPDILYSSFLYKSEKFITWCKELWNSVINKPIELTTFDNVKIEKYNGLLRYVHYSNIFCEKKYLTVNCVIELSKSLRCPECKLFCGFNVRNRNRYYYNTKFYCNNRKLSLEEIVFYNFYPLTVLRPLKDIINEELLRLIKSKENNILRLDYIWTSFYMLKVPIEILYTAIDVATDVNLIYLLDNSPFMSFKNKICPKSKNLNRTIIRIELEKTFTENMKNIYTSSYYIRVCANLASILHDFQEDRKIHEKIIDDILIKDLVSIVTSYLPSVYDIYVDIEKKDRAYTNWQKNN